MDQQKGEFYWSTGGFRGHRPVGILSPGTVSWMERKECQGMSSPVEGVGEEAGSSTEPFGGGAFCLCSSSGKSALVTLPVQVFLVLIIRQVRGQQTTVLFPLGPGIVHRGTTHVEGNQRLKHPPAMSGTLQFTCVKLKCHPAQKQQQHSTKD